MKVLIVDDDAIVIESCRRILNAEQIETHIANNAGEAKAILQSEQFDLMITDIKMPQEDGFSLIAWAKEKLPKMRVLMMTGYLTPDTEKLGENSGANSFIAKPFTPDELLEQIQLIT